MATTTIKRGDTLGALAKQYGTTTDNLVQLNPNITDPDRIQAGATLNIPEAQQQSTPTSLVQDGAVDGSTINAPTSANMPEPTADAEAETFQAGLQADVSNARTNLEKTIKEQRDAALKRQEELNTKLESLMKESDPENRATFEQEERIIQNQLDAAETASETIEEDFKKRRATVSELDRLLTEGNQLIAQKKNQPVALSVLNKSVNRTIQDVQARAGVLDSVLAGLDGNIAQAHNIINTAQGTVRAYWQDQQNYNQAYLSLVESGQLAKNKIENDYAQSQITLAENKLNTLEETSNYIKELMIDPQSAQFIADAGVTLNDSVEEINLKMSEQSRKMEINDTINELRLDGYEYVPFAEGREDVVQLEVGGKTLSFVPPVEETGGRSVGEEPISMEIPDYDTFVEELLETPNGQQIINQIEQERKQSLTQAEKVRVLKDSEVVSSLYNEAKNMVSEQVTIGSASDSLGVTTRDLNKGLVNAGMTLQEFTQLPEVEQRKFIFGSTDSGGSSSSGRDPI